ncbi:MAG: hypothetical protein AB2L24_29395 [Mangrovibacterium sp.]
MENLKLRDILTLKDPKGNIIGKFVLKAFTEKLSGLNEFFKLDFRKNTCFVLQKGSTAEIGNLICTLQKDYTPVQCGSDYVYRPILVSKRGAWTLKSSFFQKAGGLVMGKEPNLEYTGSLLCFLNAIISSLKEELGEVYTCTLHGPITGYRTIKFKGTGIHHTLDTISAAFDLQWECFENKFDFYTCANGLYN